MSVRLVVLAALAAALVGVDAAGQTLTVGGRQCATEEPGVGRVLQSLEAVEDYRVRVSHGAGLVAEEEPVVVPVAFHIITYRGEGAVTDDRIAAQMDVLNEAFGPMGFRFVLTLVQRIESAAWASGLTINSSGEAAMKQALALDPSRVLNVYTAALGLDYLGWAVLPDEVGEADPAHGVVLHHATLPGGDAAPFNLGHTGTHEVGHWAGLLHTFDGGCSSPNDGVDDTPQERSAATGCPSARDSCPLDPGQDPVTNYMDYSDDACMTGFTAGQRVRAQALTRKHRPTLVAGGGALATVASAAFDGALISVPVSTPLRVTNLTGAPLTVTSATSTDPAFQVEARRLTVAPGAVASLEVTFVAAEVGDYEGTLRLETDHPEVGVLEVAVRASTLLAPAARLATSAIEAELLEDEQALREVVLMNGGGSPLEFALGGPSRGVASVTPASGTVPVGEEVRLAVTVSAAALPVGQIADALVITTNDPHRQQISVPVRLSVLARPDALAVAPVFPNPGRGLVTVPLELPADATVTVEVFDVQGRRVAVLADGARLDAGYPRLTWDASRAAPGLYVIRALSDGSTAVGRATIAR